MTLTRWLSHRQAAASVVIAVGALAFAAARSAQAQGAGGPPPVQPASPHAAAATTNANPHGARVQACADCHEPASWVPAHITSAFHHPASFPLEGAHARTQCTACHKTLEFSGVSKTCGTCHTDVHRGSVGADCARCHTTRSFIAPEQMRRMHDLSRFPLRGAHAMAQCEQCHVPAQPGQAQYTNRSTACISCHLGNYRAAKVPDHEAGHYATDCGVCHSNTTWDGATFNHAATAFPLTGAHQAAACNDCHADQVFKGKSTACASCHLGQYNGTTNPAHAAASFPTTCESCHTTTAWTGATFDHDGSYFPINSGAHLGRWSTCADCHTSPTSYAVFTCTTCHTKSQTDPHHTGVSGYVWDSLRCYACHPRGRAG